MFDIKILLAIMDSKDAILEQTLAHVHIADYFSQSICDTAKTKGELYRKMLSSQPDLLICDKRLFSSSLNLLCDNCDVILLSDKNESSDGNISYLRRPVELTGITSLIANLFTTVDEQSLAELRSFRKKDFEQYPKRLLEENEKLLQKPEISRIAERRLNREAIRNGSIVLCTSENNDKMDTQDQLVFYSSNMLKMMNDLDRQSVKQNDSDIVNLVWVTRPKKTLYTDGDPIEFDGGEVGIAYRNGKSETIRLSAKNLPLLRTAKLGMSEISFLIQGKELPLSITVHKKPEPTIVQLFVVNPCKTKYFDGEKPDLSALVLFAKYSDDKIVQIKNPVCDKAVLSVVDTELNLSVGKKTISIPIQVLPAKKKEPLIVSPKTVMQKSEKEVLSISVCSMPEKTEYPAGFSSLNLTGGMLAVLYSDGTAKQIPFDDSDVSITLDHQKIGSVPATISYCGKTTILMFSIHQPRLVQTELLQMPKKTHYLDGEVFCTDGMSVQCTYDNGSVQILTDFGKQNPVHLGESVYPVKVGNLSIPVFICVEEFFDAKALVLKKIPNKTEYICGSESLDLAGCEVVQVNDQGSEHLIPYQDCSISGFRQNSIGKQVVILSYQGLSCSFPILVREKRLLRISVDSSPNKTEYFSEDEYCFDGLTVSAYFDDNTSAKVTDFKLDKKYAAVGDTQITVLYQDKRTTFSVHVTPKVVTMLVVAQLPRKIAYLEKKDDFSPEGGELLVFYNNGSKETIPISLDMIHGFHNDEPGIIDLTVSYGGQTTSFSVKIVAKQLLGLTVLQEPDKTEYVVGELFDPSGLKLMGFFDNGETSEISDYQWMPLRPLEESDGGVILVYMDKSTAVKVLVHPKQVSDISTSIEKSQSIQVQLQKKISDSILQKNNSTQSTEKHHDDQEISFSDEDVSKKTFFNPLDSIPVFYPSSFGLRFDDGE